MGMSNGKVCKNCVLLIEKLREMERDRDRWKKKAEKNGRVQHKERN